MLKKITVALAGNPNSGKTTVFNNLTGAHQHVGNYPGVTVEKKEGIRRYGIYEIKFVDLPGTYSLSAYSIEEMVARSFLIDEKPDVLVDVIDSSNLERNLYLATQFMELDVPLVLAFNMSDVAETRGMSYDREMLSRLLGAPIVSLVSHRNRGTMELLDSIITTHTLQRGSGLVKVNYGSDIEKEIDQISELITSNGHIPHNFNARWTAIKLLEDDLDVKQKVVSHDLNEAAEKSAKRLESLYGEHPEAVISDKRYGFIAGACQEAVTSSLEVRHSRSDIVDAIVTNRFLGYPIFLALMYLTFYITFALGEPPMGWLETLFGWLSKELVLLWPAGSASPLKSLLVNGIIGGVGGVVVFLPNILLLFLAIAVLEDSGYMARAAFIMDRLMHKIGLHGKSFIPMLIGFGCSIPAIMATRILDSKRDRLTTMLVIPLMSCGARLPIYALIIPAFFPQVWHAPMLWLIYLIGIALAVIAAKVLRATVFKGESLPFVMELPPYRMPTLKSVMIHMWERGWLYLKKAGTVILGISIILWALTSYPVKTNFDKNYTALKDDARQNYLEQSKQLNVMAGLEPGQNYISAALGLEQNLKQVAEKFHPHEQGYLQAQKNVQNQLDSLKNLPRGDILAAFLKVRDEVTEVRNRFVEVVADGDFKVGSPEYSVMESDYHLNLQKIKNQHPEVYGAVQYYLDSIAAPYEKTVNNLHREKESELMAYSVAGRIGHGMEPVLKPMGFDWRIGTALIGAFAAKEVFVAQMGIVFSVGDEDSSLPTLRDKLKASYTPLAAFCIMLFTLISTPCMSTLATVRKESQSWMWAFVQLIGLTLLAFILTTLVYQTGLILERLI